jgi:AcrR family transcriptional regulator
MPVERLTPERRRELTRTALVEAASEVFARRGFHAASLDEIAEAAGFTRGAIYSNFGGKEDLLIAALDLHTERQLAAFGAAIEFDQTSGASAEERTAAAASVWAALQRESNLPALSLEMRLYALRNPNFRRRLAASERGHQEQIARFIGEVARAEGRILPMAPIDLAELLRAFSDGLSQLASVDEERADYYDGLAVLLFALIDKAMAEAPVAKKTKRRT